MLDILVNKIEKLDKRIWCVLTFIILLLLMVLLNFDIIKHPYIMMEDGPIFLNGAYHKGLIGTIFETYGGYLYVLSRLIGWIAIKFGIITNSFIVTCQTSKFLSIFFSLFVLNYINNDKFKVIIESRLIRLLLSIILLFVSSCFLSILYCNVCMNWWSGLYVCLVSLLILNKVKLNVFEIIVLIISILTIPISFTIVIPMLYVIYNSYKTYGKKFIKRIIFAFPIFLALLFQGISMLMSKNVDSVGTVVLTIENILEKLFLSLKLTIMSFNYIFSPSFYKFTNNNNISLITGLLMLIFVLIVLIRKKKFLIFVYSFCTIYLIYFMTLFKRNDYIEYYERLCGELYKVWYHFIPGILVTFLVIYVIYLLLEKCNVKILSATIFSAYAVFLVIMSIINYNAPDLSYVHNVYDVEKHVDYRSNSITCVSIPPSWVDWCVDVPVKESYCDEHECSIK